MNHTPESLKPHLVDLLHSSVCVEGMRKRLEDAGASIEDCSINNVSTVMMIAGVDMDKTYSDNLLDKFIEIESTYCEYTLVGHSMAYTASTDKGKELIEALEDYVDLLYKERDKHKDSPNVAPSNS